MKILFGSFSAITTLGGGVETQVRSLANALRQKGIEVELFDPWKRYNLKEFDFFHLFGANLGTYHFGRSIKNTGVKLVVTPIFYSRSNPKKLRFYLMLGTGLRKYGGFWSEHLFCKELCEMAELVIVNTKAELNLIEQGLGVSREKMQIVPNGVDKRFAYASPELFIKEHGLRDFVLYVGHIGWGRKNVLPLLKVLRKTGLKAVLIGPVLNNTYGLQCLKIVAETPSIKLIPGLAGDSPMIESAYAACDTFILPSLYETPGLAALEAGLAGAKICITKYGGTIEYFGENATYLDPKKEKSIEEALITTINKPKTTALQKHIKDNYTWDKCAAKLLDIYSQYFK
ncbi:glycosyltransferase family 4 protein [candidate division WOR-3 bacterium]|nr:glycosyltransferase family 4 protein [candidate division WOR-3 bacterium]